MSIEHNTYLNGAVQSLGLTIDGRRVTVGMIEPGDYTFDTTERETITVLAGELMVDDRVIRPAPYHDHTVTAEANNRIYVVATGPVAYICYYG